MQLLVVIRIEEDDPSTEAAVKIDIDPDDLNRPPEEFSQRFLEPAICAIKARLLRKRVTA